MQENKSNEQMTSHGMHPFEMLEKSGTFEVLPCERTLDFENENRFIELELSDAQRMQVSALMQHIPNAMASTTLAQAYIAKFPEGLPHTLTALKQGGYGSMIRGESGHFVGTASFYDLTTSAAVMGAFTAMSVASSQYFLAQINNEMQIMRMKLDEILEFLYGDKKAELIAEMSFIKQIYQNYASIMTHDYQRIATLVSLQQAKKVAMQDIEFYINDLKTTIPSRTKDYADLESKVKKSFRIKESLELSKQLYIMSSLMEVYLALNQDAEYLKALEKDMLTYIDKSDKRMLGHFSALNGHVIAYKPKPMEKVDKSKYESSINSVIDTLNSEEESALRSVVHSALYAFSEKNEYYISGDGNVYVKK